MHIYEETVKHTCVKEPGARGVYGKIPNEHHCALWIKEVLNSLQNYS